MPSPSRGWWGRSAPSSTTRSPTRRASPDGSAALVSSFVVALTVTPALASLLRAGGRRERRESPLVRWVAPRYEAALARAGRNPIPVFVAAGAAVVLALAVLPAIHG